MYAAKERVADELDVDLIALANNAAKRHSTKVVRELLAAASVTGAARLYVNALERLLRIPSFGRLEEREQLELIALFRRTVAHPPMTEKLLEIVEHRQLWRLAAEERLRLLSYAVGPRPGAHSGPSRGPALMGHWLTRAAALHDLLHRRPNSVAVRRFLCEPSCPLHLLRSLADLDLLIAAFGPPNSPTTLSYNRTYREDESGHAEASVVSPCPYVSSAWRVDDEVARHRLEMRSVMLTRLEELDLIRWIERNHVVGPVPERARAEAPYGLFVNARRFADAVEPIVNLIASSRGPLRFRRMQLLRGAAIRGRAQESGAAPLTRSPSRRASQKVPAYLGGHHG